MKAIPLVGGPPHSQAAPVTREYHSISCVCYYCLGLDQEIMTWQWNASDFPLTTRQIREQTAA